MSIVKNYKKFIFMVILFIFVSVCLFLFIQVNASHKLNGIENFPASYQPYLEELAKKHPNWKFTALYTDLDWNYVISQENVFGKNLVPKNYSDRWKNTNPGEYNVEVDSGWVDSSKQAVEYCMDPRNFLNEVRIFQFEALSYDAYTNNLDGIEKILYGTEFYNRQVSYLDSNGNNIAMNEKYSDLILKGAKTSLVSPYHLASRIKQEVGPFLTHSSISGTVEGYKGLYNFYNIGATSSSEPMGAIKNGLQYARDGKGASEEIKSKYLIPWNNKERAITGGAIFIGSSYINVGQNTIYLQKFDVNDERGDDLFWHQYMTNVLAPYSESKSIYNGYEKSGLLSSSISFVIPVYNNMPEIPTQSPYIEPSDFSGDNTKVYCNASGNVNIRTGPSTSYEIITTVKSQDKMTRIQKGVQSGDRWDKVVLENGIVGYIYQTYVTETPPVQIEKIELNLDNTVLQKGERKQIQVTISPQEASSHKVIYSSSNPEIASIDDQGNIQAIRSGNATITVKAEENTVQNQIEIQVYSKVTGITLDQKEIYMQIDDTFKINGNIEPDDANDKAILYASSDAEIATIDESGIITAHKEGECIVTGASNENSSIKADCKVIVVRKMDDSEIHFDSSLNVNSLEISGIDYKKNTAADIKQLITTDLEIEIVNSKNEVLADSDLVGTGCKIRVKEDGKILRVYKVILYGDANGDGKINSVDLLVLQRHILEIEPIEEIYRKASNIRKNGIKPTSVDLLLIQRHILGLQIIEQ
ncbi:MAG: Ig-like domain-containing protein [Clostridia bacterium]|nr:Ig-like domain-containing protein [Clostridia bacterium]